MLFSCLASILGLICNVSSYTLGPLASLSQRRICGSNRSTVAIMFYSIYSYHTFIVFFPDYPNGQVNLGQPGSTGRTGRRLRALRSRQTNRKQDGVARDDDVTDQATPRKLSAHGQHLRRIGRRFVVVVVRRRDWIHFRFTGYAANIAIWSKSRFFGPFRRKQWTTGASELEDGASSWVATPTDVVFSANPCRSGHHLGAA